MKLLKFSKLNNKIFFYYDDNFEILSNKWTKIHYIVFIVIAYEILFFYPYAQPIIASTRFVCQFNIEGRVRQVHAQLLGDTIYCDSMAVSIKFTNFCYVNYL